MTRHELTQCRLKFSRGKTGYIKSSLVLMFIQNYTYTYYDNAYNIIALLSDIGKKIIYLIQTQGFPRKTNLSTQIHNDVI